MIFELSKPEIDELREILLAVKTSSKLKISGSYRYRYSDESEAAARLLEKIKHCDTYTDLAKQNGLLRDAVVALQNKVRLLESQKP